jgi:BirA family transcriptional regulator, biotin operon repressor / biotin---[acetyl-CoA-carboxylase] ligase
MPLRQPDLPPHDACPAALTMTSTEQLARPAVVPLNWRPEELWLQLVPLLPGLSIEVLPSVASTNTLLLDRLRTEADVKPCLLVAEEQTAGRGRMGRPWVSRAGASLTFSLALPLAPADWSGLSLAVGLALAQALDPLPAGGRPRIGLKWPNDLWLLDDAATAHAAGRKLAGILIETVVASGRRVAVIGIGLNVLAQEAAADAFSQGQASLSELDPSSTAPQALLRLGTALVQALQRFEREGLSPPLLADYAVRDVLRGRSVAAVLPNTSEAGETTEGTAQGVDAQGALLLQTAGGVQRVLSGEVSVRFKP